MTDEPVTPNEYIGWARAFPDCASIDAPDNPNPIAKAISPACVLPVAPDGPIDGCGYTVPHAVPDCAPVISNESVLISAPTVQTALAPVGMIWLDESVATLGGDVAMVMDDPATTRITKFSKFIPPKALTLDPVKICEMAGIIEDVATVMDEP